MMLCCISQCLRIPCEIPGLPQNLLLWSSFNVSKDRKVGLVLHQAEGSHISVSNDLEMITEDCQTTCISIAHQHTRSHQTILKYEDADRQTIQNPFYSFGGFCLKDVKLLISDHRFSKLWSQEWLAPWSEASCKAESSTTSTCLS